MLVAERNVAVTAVAADQPVAPRIKMARAALSAAVAARRQDEERVVGTTAKRGEYGC